MLVTGVYGSGKSTVVADMGALLQSRGRPFGLVDVDWLGWFDLPGELELNQRVTLSNLSSICSAYLDVGVRHLVLAWSIRDQAHLDATRAAVGVPTTVVRLDVDEATVRARLGRDPTQERRTDDPARLAGFWCALLGVEVAETIGEGQFVVLSPASGGFTLGFQRVPEGKSGKNRVHLDLLVDDLDSATEDIVRLSVAPGSSPARRVSSRVSDGGSWPTRTATSPASM